MTQTNYTYNAFGTVALGRVWSRSSKIIYTGLASLSTAKPRLIAKRKISRQLDAYKKQKCVNSQSSRVQSVIYTTPTN